MTTKNNRRANWYVEKLLVTNRIIFPYLVALTFFFLFLESYTYVGFLKKFILVDSRPFLVCSIISMILVFYSRFAGEVDKPTTLENMILDLNALVFLPLAVAYWIMVVSNARNYSNYIFATFHVQPQNFLGILLLSFLLLVLKFVRFREGKNGIYYLGILNKYFNVGKNYGTVVVLIVTFSFLVAYAINDFPKTFDEAMNSTVFISTHLNYSYDQKMRRVWGFYYDYVMFVNRYTPANTTILVPPQSNHWLSSGNIGLDRFFLYPRVLIHGEVFSIPESGYDYIMIAKGEWYNDTVNWGWPKVPIKAEDIWYINPNTLEVTHVKKDFDPTDPFNSQAWGIIKIRKGIQK